VPGTATATRRLPVLHGVAVALGCWAVVAALSLAGAFAPLDLRIHDWRYWLRGQVPASDRIALVEVDDATIAAYHAWPLPRQTYALLLMALEESGAQVVGFDLLFLGPSDVEGDRLLASVTADRTNVVHAIAVSPEDLSMGAGEASIDRRQVLLRHGRPFTASRVAGARHMALPYDELLDAADALGHTAVAVDPDGVVRRIPEFVRYGDWVYPSLALRMVESAARSDTTLPQFEVAPDGLWLHHRNRPPVRVPMDDAGATAIAFAGDRESFHGRHSLLRVLQWYRDGDTTALRRAFRGKLVLVGTTATAEVVTDLGASPFVGSTPLVYMHANALDAAIGGRLERTPPAGLLLAALAALAAVLGALLAIWPLGLGTAMVGGAIALVAGADHALFVFGGYDVPATGALILPALTWATVEGYRRVLSDRDARVREREQQVARSIQQRLLPARPLALPGIEVFGVNVPAEAVGGDYYDWIPLGEERAAVALGDVSGHGVPAALLMSHLRASFHAEARPGVSTDAVVGAMHASLSRAVSPGRFATFFMASIDLRGHALAFCNAGHNPPLVVHDGTLTRLGATGIPLAMLEDSAWTEGAGELRPGDYLVLYSDGVTECPYRQEMYGEERLEALVLRLAAQGLSAAEFGRLLLADVRAFAHGDLRADDVTLVVVKRG
jgi:adenylate cyclase